MRISFELTEEDVVAANLLHYDHSPATRGFRLFSRLAGPIIGLIAVVVCLVQMVRSNSLDLTGVATAIIISLFVSTILVVLLPWTMRRSIARNARNQLASENAEGIVTGTSTMEIRGDRLLVKTRFTDSGIQISRLYDIAEFRDYVLIYLTPRKIHIVPLKNVLPEEEYRTFVATLRSLWERGGSREVPERSHHISEESGK